MTKKSEEKLWAKMEVKKMNHSMKNRFGRMIVFSVVILALILTAVPVGTTLYPSSGVAEQSSAYAAAKKITVKFKGNGGKASKKSKRVTVGRKYGALPTAARGGYSFKGWYTKLYGGKKITKKSRVSASYRTLYAHWAANEYTITFDGNGGTSSQQAKTVKYDTAVGPLPSGTKLEYELAGWYTEAVGGTKIAEDYVYKTKGDMILYAHWVLKDRVALSPSGMGNVPVWDSWTNSKYHPFMSGNLLDSNNETRMANIGSWRAGNYATLHTGSYITYLLDCKFTDLQGTLFLGWQSRLDSRTVTLNVYNDNVLAYTSPVLTQGVEPITLTVDVHNVERMKIEFVSKDNVSLPEFGLTASLGQL
jgi:uncharacterized repeat protein (TIGR02543 family)